jgi:DNA-binding protein
MSLFKMKDANIVYIGSKPPMAYVMALITAFNVTETENVVLKARGRAISRAVDVAEIARNRYLKDIRVEKIEIGSEQMPRDDGSTRGVSTISISLKIGSKAAEKAEAPPEPEVRPQAEVTAPPKAKAQPEAEPQSKDEAAPKAKAPLEKEVRLSDLKGVGKKTEEKLREAGYKTPRSIARARASTLSGKTGLSEKVASKLIDAAKDLLK